MDSKITVLDHGYVEFIEAWGHGLDGRDTVNADSPDDDYEVGIIEAARQSTQGSFRGWEPEECDCGLDRVDDNNPRGVAVYVGKHPETCARTRNPGDARLLKFLYEHQHNTPFEFAGMVIEVQAPIFVFREWHRHRTQSYNEMSARYTPLPELYYHTTVDRCVVAPTANKQAAGALVADPNDTEMWLAEVSNFYAKAEKLYQRGLNMGIPKEVSRVVMPVGHYSKMRACTNLRNWLSFLTLRLDPAAQWEIRQFASAVGQIVEKQFPRTWDLFTHKGLVP